ncbi:MAG TPA: serine/threonine-protein kinase [Candidatus Acidoferrales bacterium]|nr:serine/threonine-protein kinase [Candidatus Acidoferrales bacterium]
MTTLTKAGRYDLREELGRGAMGVVYHGFDPVIGRSVAVKTLRLSEAGTGLSREELIGRFQTEARAAGLLTHPNIVVVFDAGEEDGLFYITMEFVEGRSLQTLIDSHQPFPFPRVLKVMEQVCSALDFAHQHNVVHRDIKPANLMLTADDVVKITDFGTAKILQFGTAQTAHVMGTPSYMSPEQVKGKPVDGRSDIFSLGVILYELMTGEKPFPGQNITTVIYKIINEEPIPPRSLDSSIHPGLSAVIARALAKDPATRYQSCHELLTALKNYHDLAGPDATVRVAPAGLQSAGSAGRVAAQPRRIATVPATAIPSAPEPPVRFMLPVNTEEESSKKPGGVVLTLVLLGIIGFAGYRVYPPLLDLWQRAHAPAEAPAIPPAKSDSAPQTTNSDAADAKPESQPGATPVSAAPAVSPALAENSPAASVTQPVAAPAAAADAGNPATAATPGSAAEKIATPPKPAVPPAPSAAHLLESKLRGELAGRPLADKVQMQATVNALTLSGSLSLAEHRELLAHLRHVPQGVRVIDDTEFDDARPQSAGSASVGWIWVRSSPPGARILIDGAETGMRTPARLELQAGDHEIRVVRAGFGTAQRNVQLSSGQTLQFTETLGAQ